MEKDRLLLHKMKTSWGKTLEYTLGEIPVHEMLGKTFSLKASGNIFCVSCGRKTKKSFNQGHCFPCFQKKASCDICIVRPALCHYAEGTCREPAWGEEHCLREHVVYLSNTTQVKVGVTGAHKVYERWADQGANSALVVARCTERKKAGILELELSKIFADKTDWRALLLGKVSSVDLFAEREKVLQHLLPIHNLDLVPLEKLQLEETQFPFLSFPKKAISLSLDKTPEIHSALIAIRGQYLIFEEGGLNIRKFQGYEVELRVSS